MAATYRNRLGVEAALSRQAGLARQLFGATNVEHVDAFARGEIAESCVVLCFCNALQNALTDCHHLDYERFSYRQIDSLHSWQTSARFAIINEQMITRPSRHRDAFGARM